MRHYIIIALITSTCSLTAAYSQQNVPVRAFQQKNIEKLKKDRNFDYTRKAKNIRKVNDRVEPNDGQDSYDSGNTGEGTDQSNGQGQGSSKGAGRGSSKKERYEEVSVDPPRQLKTSSADVQTRRFIIYSIAAIIIILAIIQLSGMRFSGLLTRSSKKIARSVNIEDIENIQEHNFTDPIEQAIAEQDYAKAIRLLYLKTLQLLDSKKYIQFRRDKTNNAYVYELANRPGLQENFKALNRIFSYVHYGEFIPDSENFPIFYKQFQEIFKQI